jgi:hypothetical protein
MPHENPRPQSAKGQCCNSDTGRNIKSISPDHRRDAGREKKLKKGTVLLPQIIENIDVVFA